MENYIDSDGSVIVLKSIRPIIDYPQTLLGNMKGARRQFRYGNLHIREYDDYYTAHLDTIDPRNDPIGHLLVDAPEYLIWLCIGVSVVKDIASVLGNRRKEQGPSSLTSWRKNTGSGLIAGLVVSSISLLAANFVKGWNSK